MLLLDTGIINVLVSASAVVPTHRSISTPFHQISIAEYTTASSVPTPNSIPQNATHYPHGTTSRGFVLPAKKNAQFQIQSYGSEQTRCHSNKVDSFSETLDCPQRMSLTHRVKSRFAHALNSLGRMV